MGEEMSRKFILSFIFFILLVFLSLIGFSQQEYRKRGISITKKSPKGVSYLDYDKSWAILIGINKYKHWENLEYAVDDVKSVSNFLCKEYDFDSDHIRILLDKKATLKNIQILLEGEFVNQIGENDRLLFFWAGHGDTRKLNNGRQRGYLIPCDGLKRGKKNCYASYLSMDRISQFSKYSSAKHILFLVDACYSGFAATSRGGGPSLPKEIENYYLRLTQEPGRHIITAGRRGEQVIESPEWGHSAFTAKLLRGLSAPFYQADRDQNGLITTNELAGYLKLEVNKLTNGLQTPVYASLQGEGEFVFIRPDINELELIESGQGSSMRSEPERKRPLVEMIPADFIKFYKNKFIFGDTFGDGQANEKPPHQVEIDDFYFLTHEVTNKEYFEFVRATNSHYPVWMQSIEPLQVKNNWNYKRMGEALTAPDHPVVGVSWQDAQAYCEWVGKKYNMIGRLPTEKEWEYTARNGGEAVKFPNGENSLDNDQANLRDVRGKDKWKYTSPVGSFGRTENGICDMAGNVWEWCFDVYTGFSDQTSKESGKRVIRGGSYSDFAWQCRASKRLVIPKSSGMPNVGFRVVLVFPK